MAKRKYPDEIYVQRVVESDKSTNLCVHETAETVAVVGEEVEVAIYKLLRVAKVYSGVKII